MKIIFLNPQYFWFFIILPVIAAYEIFIKLKKRPTILFSDLSLISSKSLRKNNILFYVGNYFIKILIFATLIFTLARPVIPEKYSKVKDKGVDIVLALDVSTSMRAIDFKPNNRLYVAKEEAKNFISKRPTDRVGLVIFAGNSYTQCPLTIDHKILHRLLDETKTGMIEDGTAIGMGLATALNRLRNSKAKSKVIILLTDGRNNAGNMDPITAANLAKEFGIKIYTIGVGKDGISKIPVDHPVYGTQYANQQLDIDIETLNKIAKLSGTKFARRARNPGQLKKILSEIDKLEKTEISEKVYYNYFDLFFYFIYFTIFLFVLDIIISKMIFKRLP